MLWDFVRYKICVCYYDRILCGKVFMVKLKEVNFGLSCLGFDGVLYDFNKISFRKNFVRINLIN